MIVAQELSLKGEATLWIEPTPSPTDIAVKERTHYRACDAFGRACVSYGGLIASCIDLSGGELDTDLTDLSESSYDEISETDRISIEAYPDEWEPRRLARETLYLGRREVVAYARELVADF